MSCAALAREPMPAGAGVAGALLANSNCLPAIASSCSLISLAETTLGDARPAPAPRARARIDVRFDASASELGELRAECLERGQSRDFLRATFDARDAQLRPNDLLRATTPTRKGGGARTVGALRRSLRWDKAAGRRIVVIDFVYVLRSHRGLGVGRALLEAAMLHGKVAKPCALLVAGSESNVAAVGLYESLGFAWVEAAGEPRVEMVAPAAAVERLMRARAAADADADVAAAAVRAGTAAAAPPRSPLTVAAVAQVEQALAGLELGAARI
jgi:ribosomal protein S18 acetylase RimI-like enzyme